jgi:hypothetical protein
MMNKLKKLYRDFFGLTEQTTTTKHTVVPGLDKNDAINLAKYNKELQTTQQLMDKMKSEDVDLDEAQLINNIIDYRGGVEYVLRNPAEADAVAAEIREWATKKGFTVVKQVSSPTGKVGYFYFRLGQDPARESQRIQGYIAQKPEIKHFRFNVRGEKKKPAAPAPQQSAPENF